MAGWTSSRRIALSEQRQLVYPNVLFHNLGDGTFEQVDVGSPIRDGDNEWRMRSWTTTTTAGWTCSSFGSDYLRLNHLYHNNLAATESPNHWLKVKLQAGLRQPLRHRAPRSASKPPSAARNTRRSAN